MTVGIVAQRPTLNMSLFLVFAEYRAGTDPTKRDSVFEFIDIKPNPAGGIDIRWSSVSGKTYSLERSEDLGTNFEVLRSNIGATPGTNTLQDATSTGPGPYFYRLRVE